MPKEQVRKRGKRRPKGDAAEQAQEVPVESTHVLEPEPSGSTGIHPARAAMLAGRPIPVSAPAPPRDGGEAGEGGEGEGGEEGVADWTRGPRTESEFPFGVLDPDVKAYFRSVEEQIKDWEGVDSAGEEREDRQIFLTSVLSELRSHELPASTDPETSIILERLLPSLNDWGRRVIGDAFGDKWGELLRHRFGSHVVQSWMTLAADTLDREARGVWPPQQAKQDLSVGELPTMTSLFASLIDSLLPTLPSLLSSPYASPPIRLLLMILTPDRTLPTLGADRDGGESSLIRSKRSGKWRSGQGVKGKSIFGEDVKGKGKASASSSTYTRGVPEPLIKLRKAIRKDLMEKLNPAEWKAMGVDAVGSATVQLMLEFEVEDGKAGKPDSLFDVLTEGLVSAHKEDKEASLEPRPYLSSLLASQTGTRLCEALLGIAPEKIFKVIWKTYFQGKLGKLAGHPYSNFVVAKGVARLGKEGIEELVEEVKGSSGGRGLIKAARTSVLQALVDRSVVLPECQKVVLGLIYSCLELPADKKSSASLVPCLMTLKTFPMYTAILTGAPEPDTETPAAAPEDIDAAAEASAAAAARLAAWQNRRQAKPKEELGPNMQGCLILQGMVGMGEVNAAVLDSLTAQPLETLLAYAKNPIASHLLDSVFNNPAAAPKYRRKVMMVFMPKYRELVEDRMGSRVVDTIWEKADGYMKEKIARSLIPHLTELGGSQYGKYFIRRADVGLLDRRPDEWREKMVGVKHHFAHQKEAPVPVAFGRGVQDGEGDEGRKRKDKGRDEIDELFEGAEKTKKRKVVE
ncbi:hypothetical protein IAT38_007424 [Cryptococcus sp. DSM 104549]